MADWPYHAGARAVQARAGVVERAERIGRAVRRDVPDAAATFLEEQPFVVVGWVDPADRVWCSLVAGPRGFLHAVDDRQVAVDARPVAGDPLEALADGDPVGLLAIEPATRRRLRVNGTASTTPRGFVVAVDELIANCPRFITPREVGAVARGRSSRDTGTSLTPDQVATIEAADTFFLATTAPGAGVDASHRGGDPGFVRVAGDRLTWPDFPGNAMFLSLGNLELDHRAGVLVVDWSTGAALQLTGRAHVEWDGEDRTVVFAVEAVRETTA
jgi:uncharacterized protein